MQFVIVSIKAHLDYAVNVLQPVTDCCIASNWNFFQSFAATQPSATVNVTWDQCERGLSQFSFEHVTTCSKFTYCFFPYPEMIISGRKIVQPLPTTYLPTKISGHTLLGFEQKTWAKTGIFYKSQKQLTVRPIFFILRKRSRHKS